MRGSRIPEFPGLYGVFISREFPGFGKIGSILVTVIVVETFLPVIFYLSSVAEAEQNGLITTARFYSIIYFENCITPNTTIKEIETYLQHY
jgi:hypothetical protein